MVEYGVDAKLVINTDETAVQLFLARNHWWSFLGEKTAQIQPGKAVVTVTVALPARLQIIFDRKTTASLPACPATELGERVLLTYTPLADS
eukprot:4244883-Amphidinium_carterae.2